MIEIENFKLDDYVFEQLAQITTAQGLVVVEWLPGSKETLVTFQGRHYKGQNEEIGVTLARLLAVNQCYLLPSDLKIYDMPGTFTVGTDKELKDLFTCEWSDYSCDKLVFQCHIYNLLQTNANLMT
jgi:hypothetical protein